MSDGPRERPSPADRTGRRGGGRWVRWRLRMARRRAFAAVGLAAAAASLLVSLTAPAEARRRHHHHHHHQRSLHRAAHHLRHEGSRGYSPPYAAIVVDAKTGRSLHAVECGRAPPSRLAHQGDDALPAVRAARAGRLAPRHASSPSRRTPPRRRPPSSASSPARRSRSRTRSGAWSPIGQRCRGRVAENLGGQRG